MSTFRELVASERPLVLPGAHDALTATLIQQAGFKAYFVGGFPVAGVRYGLPDIGLLGGNEFLNAYRDILAVSSLPVLVDADNGYGDVKNVVHTVHQLERLGAQALRRAERYLRAGADGLFIEAPTSIDEMAIIGAEFKVPQLANMLEGGRTPILQPSQLEQLGFRIVIYGIPVLMRYVKTIQETLADIQNGELKLTGTGASFNEYKQIVGMDKWSRIEESYKIQGLN
jgi:2-methylisocitrate lyase-like PEP mutase family enzyme